MVGVPSSNLCLRCVKAKKRCDGRRPTCGQCTMRGLPCPGYRARFRFINRNGAELSQSDLTETTQSRETKRATMSPEWDASSALKLLPRNLCGTAKGIELICRFDDIYTPRRRSSWPPLSTDLSDLPTWEWVLPILESSQIEPLLNDIVRALVLSSVGKCDKNALYSHEGALLHARAVKTLKMRLQNEKERCSDYTLAAVMIFGTYEIQIGSVSRGDAWLNHVRGFETLLSLRARSDKPIPMFVKRLIWASQYQRLIITLRARGKPGTAPPGILFDILEQSAPVDVKLFAILHRVAPLIAKVDQYEAIPHTCCTHQRSRICGSLLSELCDLETELYAWPSTLSSNGLLYWDERSGLYSACSHVTDVPKIFEKAVGFSNVRVASGMLLTWMGLLYINAMKDMLIAGASAADSTASSTINTSNQESDASDTASYTTQAPETSYSIALRIARSFEYFLHPDFGQLGPLLIGLPLGTCWKYFEQREMRKEIWWLKVVNARMGDTGAGVGEFLHEFKVKGLSFGAFREESQASEQ